MSNRINNLIFLNNLPNLDCINHVELFPNDLVVIETTLHGCDRLHIDENLDDFSTSDMQLMIVDHLLDNTLFDENGKASFDLDDCELMFEVLGQSLYARIKYMLELKDYKWNSDIVNFYYALFTKG